MVFYQHKENLGLVHCDSSLSAVVQGEVCDLVQYKHKHLLLVTLSFV